MTGASGTGKTTSLRRFHDELQSSPYQVFYLSDWYIKISVAKTRLLSFIKNDNAATKEP